MATLMGNTKMAHGGNTNGHIMAIIKGIIMALNGNDQGHNGNNNGHAGNNNGYKLIAIMAIIMAIHGK